MAKIEVTYKNTLPVWWSYIWRVTLASIILGVIIGFITGFIVGFLGKPELGGPVGGISGYITSIPVSIWAMKMILDKEYKNFSVVLVEK